MKVNEDIWSFLTLVLLFGMCLVFGLFIGAWFTA